MDVKFPTMESWYFHREHSWAKLEKNGSSLRFIVGVDAIFLSCIGEIELIDLPNEGDEILQDEICGMIGGKERKKSLFAPLSGEIIGINQSIIDNLDLISEDPYGKGWLLLLDPSDPEEEQRNILSGEKALGWWQSELKYHKLDSD